MNSGQPRLVDPIPRSDDRFEPALRPRTLGEFIGQEKVKQNLAILIAATKQRHEPLEHVLFYGPPGLGKTTLAYILAKEMGVNIKMTSGPAVERPGDLAAILSNLNQGDVLFIDEIHRLGKTVEEVLYPAMEDYSIDIVIGKGPSARALRLNLPRFTVVGATTRLALLTAPLRARFGATFRLDYYQPEEIRQILERAAARLESDVQEGGLEEISVRARGTPRVALRLLRRVRDFADVMARGVVTSGVAQDALDLLEVDDLGLDDLDRRVLQAIVQKFSCGPVGLNTLAASVSEEPDTIMDVVEPYLMQMGFLERRAQGRVATQEACAHLGLPYPVASQPPKLF